MEIELKGRTALVTGATAGIGRETARVLAGCGARVAMVGRRESLLSELAEEISAAGGTRPELIPQDLMEESAPSAVCDRALGALGRIDILVNSAGTWRPMTIESAEDEWECAMTLNFTRIRQLTHQVLPSMIGSKWGRIIHITNKSEPRRVNGELAAKAAVHMWSKAVSRTVGKHGITVNSISPGYIMSEQLERLHPSEELAQVAADSIPAGYIGKPADIATLIAFLSSQHARYINGAVIPVDGGLRSYAY